MKGIAHHEVGDTIDLHLFIKNVIKGTASNGKPFLSITFQDKSGEIEAKLWDVKSDDEQLYVPEAIVRVSGDVQNYKGKLQLRIRAIRLKYDNEPINIADLLPTAPLGKDEMSETITKYIFEMTNPNIQRITRHLVKKYFNDFLEYPAATKNHHEFFSGLAYHVVSMLNLAKSIAELYPSLNKDLLYAGVILHDLGKVKELSGPIATTYTVEGNLLGHISIMVNEIGKVADELNIQGEEVLILQHIVLSHHGKAEWGSPKPPLVKEAEILHYIDNLDAKMNMMDRALDRVKPGEFTERIFPLDNRSLYKPNIK